MSDDVINLRGDDDFCDEPEFKIEHVKEEVPVSAPDEISTISCDKVSVRFDKFVNLIVSHDYDEVCEKYRDEEIIMSTDLLSDLASVPEQKEGKKVPLIFVFGIILGVIITWIVLKT